jgi:cyclic-di-GMP-binding protein
MCFSFILTDFIHHTEILKHILAFDAQNMVKSHRKTNRDNMRRKKMSKENSFDIVSKVELSEVTNAINLAMKEIENRYDFKGSKSDIKLEKEEVVIVSDDDYKLDQVKDVLSNKLIKRGISMRSFDFGKVEAASGGTVRQRGKIAQGIDSDNAKKINKIIKDTNLKVKSQIQDDQIRVTGKSRDELQQIMAELKSADLPLDIQFINFR